MKKLLTMAAILVMATVVRAAATDWALTCGNLYDKTGKNLFSGTFELYATGGDLTSDVMVMTLTPSLGTYNKYAFSTSDLTVGESYNFYYVLKDGDKQLTSNPSSVAYTALGTGSQTVSLGNQKTYTQNTSNWAAVPEPTSGLLLLLGMAGLALKRKRA